MEQPRQNRSTRIRKLLHWNPRSSLIYSQRPPSFHTSRSSSLSPFSRFSSPSSFAAPFVITAIISLSESSFGFHCALLIFVCFVVFFSLEGLSPATIAKIGGIHKLIGLQDYGIAAVARDSVHSLPESKGANKFGATFETPCGRLLVSLCLTRRVSVSHLWK